MAGVFSGTLWAQATGARPSEDVAQVAPAGVSGTRSDGQSSPPHVSESYIIGDDDVLAISVWKEPDLSKDIPVRSDGKISLPLVGEVQAAGRTPLQLEQVITERLRNYITDPEVTVIVRQINSQKFNILGMVTKPGSYPLTTGTSIVDAIATAGGFKDFAKKKAIYVLRQNSTGAETRIDFNYDRFIKGKDPARNIQLKPHDTIVVP
jgi:polysaccharide biosynthesis/export protein